MYLKGKKRHFVGIIQMSSVESYSCKLTEYSIDCLLIQQILLFLLFLMLFFLDIHLTLKKLRFVLRNNILVKTRVMELKDFLHRQISSTTKNWTYQIKEKKYVGRRVCQPNVTFIDIENINCVIYIKYKSALIRSCLLCYQ